MIRCCGGTPTPSLEPAGAIAMSELLAYAQLGVRHILDPAALDHLLFLLVLAAAYRLGDWRDALWVISAFTIGHSITLGLAATRRPRPAG